MAKRDAAVRAAEENMVYCWRCVGRQRAKFMVDVAEARYLPDFVEMYRIPFLFRGASCTKNNPAHYSNRLDFIPQYEAHEI